MADSIHVTVYADARSTANSAYYRVAIAVSQPPNGNRGFAPTAKYETVVNS